MAAKLAGQWVALKDKRKAERMVALWVDKKVEMMGRMSADL